MSKIMSIKSFTTHIEQATRKAGFTIIKREKNTIHIMMHDQPMPCKMDLLYNAYSNSPDRLKDIVQVHLNSLGQVPPPPPPPTEKEAAEALLPMLNQRRWLKQMQRTETIPLIHRPLAAGIVITYVFDMPQYRAYINKDMLAKMTAGPEATFDTIHEYALENLRLRTSSQNYQTNGLNEQTMISCETQDGYAATRILLPELMATWAERIPGRMLLGIPNRDFVIAFSDRNKAHVAAITKQVQHDVKKQDHPLSSSLFLWQNGKISPYPPRN